MGLVDMGCSKWIYLDTTRPALPMALFIVSLDFFLNSEHGVERWLQEDRVRCRGCLTREPSAQGEGRLEEVGEDLPSCQAALSPLLMVTGRGSQQAANVDCSAW